MRESERKTKNSLELCDLHLPMIHLFRQKISNVKGRTSVGVVRLPNVNFRL